jgi:ribose 5-phosphate isomerase A
LTASQIPADTLHEKRLAAERSLQYVRDGMCLGLGSGSTAAMMLELLGQRVRAGLDVRGIPTSERSRQLAIEAGIPLIGFEEVSCLDLTIDGADEADGELNLIKGGGGALLREKVVASFSRRVVIVVDSSKRVERLGAFPLPVEVVRFAWQGLARRLEELGGQVRLRKDLAGQPFITDEGNYILDCRFGPIDRPRELAQRLDAMPGVMEHGLFVGVCDIMLVGQGERVRVAERPSRPSRISALQSTL